MPVRTNEPSFRNLYIFCAHTIPAINPGNSGGPVANEDLKVVGVAFQGLDGAENIGYVVPVTVVQRVLHGLQRDGQYNGFCSIGIGTALLENKGFRKSLGMVERELSGIMVKEVLPMAAARGILRSRDVILQVDGIPVANDGKIPFRRGERVSLACYTQTKFPGDKLKVQVWRDGEEIELQVPVSISRKFVPAHFDNRPPPYLIVSGLVFTALSIPYLYASDAWDSYVSDQVSYLLGKWREPLEQEEDEVVVLSQVLAHQENLGYDTLADMHLQRVNDQRVRSLVHLKRLIEECKDSFIQLELGPGDNIIILEREALERVTQEVCDEHSIPKPYCLYPGHSVEGEETVEAKELAVETVNDSSTTKA